MDLTGFTEAGYEDVRWGCGTAPWLMTQSEFLRAVDLKYWDDLSPGFGVFVARASHKGWVRAALADGRRVYPEFATDYPDLALVATRTEQLPLGLEVS